MSSKKYCVRFLMFIYLMFPIYMYLLGLHSIELHSINCCLSARIKFNTNIILFEMKIKIDKDTANAYAYYEKYEK